MTGGRFGNIKRVKVDGHTFDSGTEAQRYQVLKKRQAKGSITSLKIHPRIPIIVNDGPVLLRSQRYKNGRRMTYVADFSYWDVAEAQIIIEDVKMASGYRTEVYKIKRALVEAMGLEIVEV